MRVGRGANAVYEQDRSRIDRKSEERKEHEIETVTVTRTRKLRTEFETQRLLVSGSKYFSQMYQLGN